MKEQVVLVDFENVQKLDLARLPAHARIRIFVGALQAKLPTALVLQAQASGHPVEWIRIEGNGPNALDFHIACHLGEGLARTPQAEFVVVSRDTGFDPLLRHLKARGLHCRREAPAAIVKAAPKPVVDTNAQQVVELLKRTEKSKRPRKRKTLVNYLATHFQKKLTPEHVMAAIDQLVKAKLLGGTYSALAYNF
ncbi:MAG: PIN domain-containing protein [Steroidobacteraceae bacterium]